MEATVITYCVDIEESIETHFQEPASRMARQPLPSMFAPPPPSHVDPPVIYPQFISYVIEPEFTPMCDTPNVSDGVREDADVVITHEVLLKPL